MVKNLLANAGDARDAGLIPASGRSPEGGNGNMNPVFMPGEFHGQRSLVGYNPQGRPESDMTGQLSPAQLLEIISILLLTSNKWHSQQIN